jgi:PAS domain S-box-containing protein
MTLARAVQEDSMNSGKVLIVEDEPIVAMDLKQEIEELGYEVVGVAESADDALKIVQDAVPDFALMDIRIVGSMDGIQTARALRHWYRVPSIFLTSYSDDATLARAARVMPYGYLTKPFKSAELRATLKMALEHSRADARDMEEREQVTETFNGIPEGIITVSCKGNVRFMNYAAEKLAGWSAASAKGRPVEEVLRWCGFQNNEVPCLNSWTSDLKGGEWLGCAVAQPGGARTYVDVSLASLADSDGEHRGYVITLRDASHRMHRQAAEEIEHQRPCFDRAPMAMIQMDAEGRIERVNEALLLEAGVAAERVLGRTLTGLNMDPDPRIARNLIPKLLKATTFITTVKPQMAN